ncbi:twin-arginine translocation pathway signal [Burkholderia cepacia]|uniref:Twin-arginine translocation pathway signal n=1 Tax=Burkholderia cepacia TaxID=292 RepID=A0A0J5ZU59_BURCE|nr:insecticidal delta-endotoxin Cry8Ea1 family protein [Burkholderia cepacia]KML57010.1 twin-arginine translocation pathway signal [Burkholderia cepacia]
MLTRRTLLKTIPVLGSAWVLPTLYAAPVTVYVDINQDDILDTLKTIVTWGLGQIPEVGSILAAIVSLLWPSGGPDAWDLVRKEVEAMIDSKINDAVYSLLKAELDGLGGALKLYFQAVAAHDMETIRMQFIATNTLFVAAASKFQNKDYRWTLAPLFAIFSQLHLLLLRDAVLNGKNWGGGAEAYANVVTQAGDTAEAYIGYLDMVVADERSRLEKGAPASPGQHRTEIYNYWQPFESKRIVLIDDYRTLLVYLDPVKHPDASQEIPFKDVYSRAYGTADDWDQTCSNWSKNAVATPYSAPLASFSSIYIELWNRTPRVVRVQYPKGAGPKVWGGNRTDRTEIIANAGGGREKYTVTLPKLGPGKLYNVKKAHVTSGSIPIGLTLELDDSRRVELWNRTDLPGTPTHEVAVLGRMLTTFNMWTRSRFYDNDLGCLILGFSRDTRRIPPHAKDAFYVGALTEPNTGPQYLPRAISPSLLARRNAFWRDIFAR